MPRRVRCHQPVSRRARSHLGFPVQCVPVSHSNALLDGPSSATPHALYGDKNRSSVSRHVPCPGTGFGSRTEAIGFPNRLIPWPLHGAGLTHQMTAKGSRCGHRHALGRWPRQPPVRPSHPLPEADHGASPDDPRTAEIPRLWLSHHPGRCRPDSAVTDH